MAVDIKQIRVDRIDSKSANIFVKRCHYSGKVVNNSQLHFGAFYDGVLHGVLSFGPSMDKSKLLGVVHGTGWNEFVELNRMAFDDFLPRNSESRCISIALKLIKKHCPHIKWVVSFADAMQCGDGTIYRAAGFLLTGISEGGMWGLPESLVELNGGPVAHKLKVQDKDSKLSQFILSETNGKNLTIEACAKRFGGKVLPGFMFRYVYLIDKTAKLAVEVIPYSKIAEIGGKMYKGISSCVGSVDSDTSPVQGEEGGANPTLTLHDPNGYQETGKKAVKTQV